MKDIVSRIEKFKDYFVSMAPYFTDEIRTNQFMRSTEEYITKCYEIFADVKIDLFHFLQNKSASSLQFLDIFIAGFKSCKAKQQALYIQALSSTLRIFVLEKILEEGLGKKEKIENALLDAVNEIDQNEGHLEKQERLELALLDTVNTIDKTEGLLSKEKQKLYIWEVIKKYGGKKAKEEAERQERAYKLGNFIIASQKLSDRVEEALASCGRVCLVDFAEYVNPKDGLIMQNVCTILNMPEEFESNKKDSIENAIQFMRQTINAKGFQMHEAKKNIYQLIDAIQKKSGYHFLDENTISLGLIGL